MKTYTFILVFILLALYHKAYSQNQIYDFFNEVELRTDTSLYTWSGNSVFTQNKRNLYFYYEQNEPICEIRLYPYQYADIQALELIKSQDFEVLEDLVRFGEEQFRFKVKFKSLNDSRFLNFSFKLTYFHLGIETTTYCELPLFPCTFTKAFIYPKSDELFIGEEQLIEITTNHPENIQLQNYWTTSQNIDYRITQRQNKIYLHLLPNKLGTHKVTVRLHITRPYLSELKRPSYQLPPIVYTFKVKPARLAFLKVSASEVILNEKNRNEGIEAEIAYHWGLKIGKTYRLEATEAAGGALKAEIFTRKFLSNEKVLCWIRVYNYHRKEDGYLYIKDGDYPVFITNFDILPQTQIEKISILHEGKDWTGSRTVFPGEKIEIKIEGQALQRASLYFEGLTEVVQDSSLRTETSLLYKAAVPININKKQITIHNRSENTNQSLQVQEFQQAREFDFIQLKCNKDEIYELSEVGNQIVTSHTLEDLILIFDEDKIDDLQKLYGTQYLEIEVRLTDQNNRLADSRTTEVQVCPGISSPRYNFYQRKNCTTKTLSINSLVNRKIYELLAWSSIELTIKHQSQKYGEEIFTKRVKIILRSRVDFDVNVSFPAGLLVKKLEDKGYGNLWGISMAVIAQFGFYDKTKINRLRPYKIGAGFLALNAFNFNADNSGRDVGMVVLASLHPLQKYENRKLSFPIYLGGGYFLSESKWFLLLGPGIHVQF
jgi:hypothetical protein